MRKLNILKTIVDFFWIMSLPVVPIILFFVPAIFFIEDLNLIPFKINGTELFVSDTPSKIILSISLLSYLLLVYIVYLFKKILRYFKNLKIFNNYVIVQLNKIGYLLIISSFLNSMPVFIYRLMVKQKFSFEIGLSPFFLLISSGLFFMILSEVFKVSQNMKNENELTI